MPCSSVERRRPRLADGASTFLDGLSTADALLVVDGTSRERREDVHRRAAMLAARMLGLRVIVIDEAGRNPDAIRDIATSVLAELGE